MTTAEACALNLDLVRQLTVIGRERDSWRLIAMAATEYAAELRRELEMTDARSYIWRRRTEDQRDVWADQRDLETSEAA